ncbi:allene oxide synthase-lipoxygenase protein-like [Mizuhopecten yessoensis]|uniref:Allene oxide synthase-lipoxygenase protein n=1 Tax=Mizuhopecten yessoensis TaxID=6573 RepID=A0A210Q7Z8_MIZYE|nr:allene oxide synthase-lipoxygenase protein-like [Mizuhopecten yessoensis]OWF44853.1 Allene oxide synthase-lipoxygenase protein [Mizuhopecten yessoensis]
MATTPNRASGNEAPDGPTAKDNLQSAKDEYQLVESVRGLPSRVKTLPRQERFNCFEKLRAGVLLIVLGIVYLIDRFLTRRWDKLSDLLNAYRWIVPKPPTPEIWRDDAFFGRQRLVGVNPFVIRLCTAIPGNMKENVNKRREFLQKVLQQKSGKTDFTLDTAIQENRLFIVDYDILDGMKDTFGLCSPIALFLVDAENELMPIAIQLYQTGENNPMFLPEDPSWLMAKLWFNHADSSYQDSFSHLGVTHLLMESVDVVTHRNLTTTHPVYEILAPHFLYLLAINTKARDYLINKNGIVDETRSIGREGTFEIIRRQLLKWRMDEDGTLPRDLEIRGVEGEGTLPGYYYRDDALLVYDAIQKYVHTYIHVYYDDDGYNGKHQVSNDAQIQAWVAALIAKREPVNGGCEIKGIPLDKNGSTISTCDQLVQILTSTIYMCSVGHAVTNFPQYEQYGFQPAYPAGMRGSPPQDPNIMVTETAIIKAIPPKITCLLEMVVMKFLSTRNTRCLGNFITRDSIPLKADDAVKQFRKDLKKAAVRIEERNSTRTHPYPWASPDNIPNSISI